jgi:hypothetical protein
MRAPRLTPAGLSVAWPRVPAPSSTTTATGSRSGSPTKRLRELQVGSPVELKTHAHPAYAERRDADAVAEELHRCFAGASRRGYSRYWPRQLPPAVAIPTESDKIKGWATVDLHIHR